jgi:phosphoserine phosphatase
MSYGCKPWPEPERLGKRGKENIIEAIGMPNEVRLIHLVRHGETDWNRDRRAQGQMESMLTEAGRQQAIELGRTLRNLPLDEAYVSNSLRTRQTAELALAGRQLQTHFCDQLREIRMGDWEGCLYSDIQRRDPEQFHAFWHAPMEFALPGAETFTQVQQRALSRLEQILRESTARHIAIISHGVVIKSILCAFEPRPLADLWQPPTMHNCSHSTLEVRPDRTIQIIRYSDQPYPAWQVEL